MAKLRRPPVRPEEFTSRAITSLEKRVSAGARRTPEAWHVIGSAGEPAYAGTWNGNAAFMKDLDGFVWLRGAAGGGAAGTMFTLPAGYRPGVTSDFATSSWNGAAMVFGAVRVDTGGLFFVLSGPFNSVPVDQIRYRAEN